MRFGIIGAAGYVAPRHMAAIVANGGEIVTACDTHDSVGILDKWAPDARFCAVPTTWFRDELRDVDVVVVCTPNYLHCPDTIRALDAGCDVILEKPAANRFEGMSSAQVLMRHERRAAGRVTPIVQLRYHPQILARSWRAAHPDKAWFRDVQIDYAVTRGAWYDVAWKGRPRMSGGLLVNLGVHLFDLVLHMFGRCVDVGVEYIDNHTAAGSLTCECANVHWRLRSDAQEQQRVFRVDGHEIDLTTAITELHGEVYRRYMAGEEMPTLEDASRALELIDRIKEIAGCKYIVA